MGNGPLKRVEIRLATEPHVVHNQIFDSVVHELLKVGNHRPRGDTTFKAHPNVIMRDLRLNPNQRLSTGIAVAGMCMQLGGNHGGPWAMFVLFHLELHYPYPKLVRIVYSVLHK